MAKTLCSDVAMKVTTDAVQLHGGYGYTKDFAVERMMRDAKVCQIWEGTNQIQRLLVGQIRLRRLRFAARLKRVFGQHGACHVQHLGNALAARQAGFGAAHGWVRHGGGNYAGVVRARPGLDPG